MFLILKRNVSMSTHNVCFDCEMRKWIHNYLGNLRNWFSQKNAYKILRKIPLRKQTLQSEALTTTPQSLQLHVCHNRKNEGYLYHQMSALSILHLRAVMVWAFTAPLYDYLPAQLMFLTLKWHIYVIFIKYGVMRNQFLLNATIWQPAWPVGGSITQVQ